MHRTKVKVVEEALDANNTIARANRADFDRASVRVVNFMSAPGAGKPQYSKNHLVRQRLTVARMLCPMCGEPTEEGDRWTQIAARRCAGQLRARGGQVRADIADDRVMIDAGSIAPLHRRCVDRSMKYCPHLRASDDVMVMRFPREWIVLPLLIKAETGPGVAVAFLQLCGVTQTIDRRWRAETAA